MIFPGMLIATATATATATMAMAMTMAMATPLTKKCWTRDVKLHDREESIHRAIRRTLPDSDFKSPNKNYTMMGIKRTPIPNDEEEHDSSS